MSKKNIIENWKNSIAELPENLALAMGFLMEHLPTSDLINYPFGLFLQFAEHAVFLRENVAWCAQLDQELFDHYVLFPRVNDEDLSFHRKLFYDEVLPRIEGINSAEERVLEVNRLFKTLIKRLGSCVN